MQGVFPQMVYCSKLWSVSKWEMMTCVNNWIETVIADEMNQHETKCRCVWLHNGFCDTSSLRLARNPFQFFWIYHLHMVKWDTHANVRGYFVGIENFLYFLSLNWYFRSAVIILSILLKNINEYNIFSTILIKRIAKFFLYSYSE